MPDDIQPGICLIVCFAAADFDSVDHWLILLSSTHCYFSYNILHFEKDLLINSFDLDESH